jgi:hypothetical protein
MTAKKSTAELLVIQIFIIITLRVSQRLHKLILLSGISTSNIATKKHTH